MSIGGLGIQYTYSRKKLLTLWKMNFYSSFYLTTLTSSSRKSWKNGKQNSLKKGSKSKYSHMRHIYSCLSIYNVDSTLPLNESSGIVCFVIKLKSGLERKIMEINILSFTYFQLFPTSSLLLLQNLEENSPIHKFCSHFCSLSVFVFHNNVT